jgi:hypothetical protein
VGFGQLQWLLPCLVELVDEDPAEAGTIVVPRSECTDRTPRAAYTR